MAISQVDLVGDIRPVVTPSATATMAQSVRDGTISILDIMDRVDARTKAKQELELITAQQGIANAQDPQLIQAARNQKLAEGATAQNVIATAPLARRATEEKLFGDINSGQIQRYGLKEKLAALNELGFAPSPDPQKGITAEFAAEVNKNFASLLRWQKDKADAKFELANIKQGEVDTGRGIFSGPTDILTAAPIEQGKVEALRNRAAKTLPEFLRDAPPGGVVAPVAVQAPPPIAQAAPVIQPVAPAAPTVVQPAQVAAPITQPSGVPPGFTQVKPAPVTAATKQTDALQRELVNVDLTKQKIDDARKLVASGVVGPSQIAPIRGLVQAGAAILPSGFGGDTLTKKFTAQRQLDNTISGEIADFVQTWKGAISDKELKFFQAARPSVDSTPELWTRYLDTWEEKNDRIRKIVAGQLDPAEPDIWAVNPKSATLGAPTAPLPASPSAAPIVSTIAQFNALPAGTVFREPDGTLRKKP